MEYLKKLLNKTGWLSLVESMIFAIIGIILIRHPEGTIKAISYILGAVFIVIGLYKIIMYAYDKSKGESYSYNAVYGFMAIVIGIVTIAFSGTIGELFRIIIGVWIIYSGLIRATYAFKIKSPNSNTWLVSLVLALLMIICGIYVLVNKGAIVTTIGVLILVYAIIDIIENVIFIKNINSID